LRFAKTFFHTSQASLKFRPSGIYSSPTSAIRKEIAVSSKYYLNYFSQNAPFHQAASVPPAHPLVFRRAVKSLLSLSLIILLLHPKTSSKSAV